MFHICFYFCWWLIVRLKNLAHKIIITMISARQSYNSELSNSKVIMISNFLRGISPKDLKVFLCDHMNYKLEIDELGEIMKVGY